jgi:hypothetical protein
VDADPDALLLKESEYVEFEATVCGVCGYAEFYAKQPTALLKAWSQSRKG